jgi:hypothetical protein
MGRLGGPHPGRAVGVDVPAGGNRTAGLGMTNRDQDLPPGENGDEPELTEAMLHAGLGAFFKFNEDYESPEDAVRRIYVAMIEAKVDDPARLVVVAVGEIGVAVYPGQSPVEVLTLARVIEVETYLGPYSARDVARKLLRELAVLRGES